MRVPHPGGDVAVVRTKPSVVDDVSGRTLSPDDVFPHHWLARVRKGARVSQLQIDHQFGGGGPSAAGAATGDDGINAGAKGVSASGS